MARTMPAKEAQPKTAPFAAILALFAVLAGSAKTSQPYLAAKRMEARTRRWTTDFATDIGANSAVTGVIELLIGFIVLVFAVLIAFLLLPLVNDSSAKLMSAANTSAQQKSVIPIVGLVLIIALVIMALGFLFAGFKNVIHEFR